MKNLSDYNNEFNNLYKEIDKSIKNLSTIDSYVGNVNQYLTKTKEINDGLNKLIKINNDNITKTSNSIFSLESKISILTKKFHLIIALNFLMLFLILIKIFFTK